MNDNIKYSKDLEWLKPFVDSAHKLVNLDAIKSIRSYKVKAGLKEQTYGSIIKTVNGECRININPYVWNKKKKKYIGETMSVVLDTLAHELSHIKHFNHNYKHFRTQSLILLKFSGIIKKLKIEDTSKRFNN